MTVLTTAMSQSGEKILARDGRLLCSPRNPVLEANEWLARQKIKDQDRKILVLGYGSGFHVQALLSFSSDLSVTVIELDPQICPSEDLPTTVQLLKGDGALQLRMADYDLVVLFRPSWSGLEKEYVDLHLQLTQQKFRLKELDFVERDGAEHEVKLWRCLRELIE